MENDATEIAVPPLHGEIPAALGIGAAIRIPIPATHGLAVEFRPRWPTQWRPKGGTTSSIHFQDRTGRRHLRLDYGYNARSKSWEFHWNQKGTKAVFGIENHVPLGESGRTFYLATKSYKYFGRVLVLVGAALDGISIVQASQPIRRATEVVSAWALAWVGCRVGGSAGAALTLAAGPAALAAGGIGGCIIGADLSYRAGAALGARVYQWLDGTSFRSLPEMVQG